MRHKAKKLEKGSWYADLPTDNLNPTFLKYEKTENGRCCFSKQKGEQYYEIDQTGFISINSRLFNGFIPTDADVKKYNLNETDK